MNPLPQFSHLYYENAASDFPLTTQVCARYAHIPKTEIGCYTEIFNRKRQHFQIQKRSQALILAISQKNFLYRGDQRIQSFGASGIHYTDQVRNCIYNCSYCFLQGMHQSAHCVLFVNETDYHSATLQELEKRGSLNLSISYLSDLLAFEHVIPLCRKWIELARHHPRLSVEIRTKSNNIHALQETSPADNVVLVWSLTPRYYAQRFEHGTASLPNRLLSARRAIELGWKVRICFDPIIINREWRARYRQLLQETFSRLPAEKISAISYGTFRMHGDYFTRILRQQPQNAIMHADYRRTNKMVTHTQEDVQEMRTFFEEEIGGYYPLEKVFFVHG